MDHVMQGAKLMESVLKSSQNLSERRHQWTKMLMLAIEGGIQEGPLDAILIKQMIHGMTIVGLCLTTEPVFSSTCAT